MDRPWGWRRYGLHATGKRRGHWLYGARKRRDHRLHGAGSRRHYGTRRNRNAQAYVAAVRAGGRVVCFRQREVQEILTVASIAAVGRVLVLVGVGRSRPRTVGG